MLVCWADGLLGCWVVGCRVIGFMGCWADGLLGVSVGLLGGWFVGLLV